MSFVEIMKAAKITTRVWTLSVSWFFKNGTDLAIGSVVIIKQKGGEAPVWLNVAESHRHPFYGGGIQLPQVL